VEEDSAKLVYGRCQGGLAGLSTKSSIVYGKNFHLYDECMEDAHIYLTLKNIGFEATNTEVTVAIPIVLWEHLRSYSSTNFDISKTDWTDEQIKEESKKAVKDRLKINPENGFARWFGAMIFGDFNLPPEEQVENAVRYWTEERKRQQLLKAELESLKKKT